MDQHEMEAQREPVPADVYADVDFDELNAKVSRYRELIRDGGFEAALPALAEEPVAIRGARK